MPTAQSEQSKPKMPNVHKGDNMSFFPEEIQTESVSHYMKLKPGVNTFRILGDPFPFLETWVPNEGGGSTPKRFEIKAEVDSEQIGPDGIKQVVAFPVYNYADECVQVLTLHQKTILSKIKAYTENEKYGDPVGYDFNVKKTGEGKKTRYETIADPKEDLSDEASEAWDEVEIDLETMLVNGDPFLE